jgi:superfamily II DNA helicase RecQ
LAELGVTAPAPTMAGGGGRSMGAKVELDEGDPVVATLREWRSLESAKQGKPAYVVFDNKTLVAIAAARPSSIGELAEVSGVGPAKLERYGETVVDLVRAAGGDD